MLEEIIQTPMRFIKIRPNSLNLKKKKKKKLDQIAILRGLGQL
jgi:hypothetical protein